MQCMFISTSFQCLLQSDFLLQFSFKACMVITNKMFLHLISKQKDKCSFTVVAKL